MNLCKMVLMGLLIYVWQSIPMAALAAPKTAAGQKSADASTAQKAIDECKANFCGRRAPSISGSRPMRIEACFHEKMGRFPAEMGIPVGCPQNPYH